MNFENIVVFAITIITNFYIGHSLYDTTQIDEQNHNELEDFDNTTTTTTHHWWNHWNKLSIELKIIIIGLSCLTSIISIISICCCCKNLYQNKNSKRNKNPPEISRPPSNIYNADNLSIQNNNKSRVPHAPRSFNIPPIGYQRSVSIEQVDVVIYTPAVHQIYLGKENDENNNDDPELTSESEDGSGNEGEEEEENKFRFDHVQD